MADPFTLAASAIGLGGSLMSGMASRSMYQYRSGIAGFNQQVALQNRDYAMQAGETQARDYGMKSRFQAGQIVAAQGASGMDVGGGSAQAVQAGQKLVSSIDMNQIRENAARRATGFQNEAAGYGAEKAMYAQAADYAVPSSLLGGAFSVADKWLRAKPLSSDSSWFS